MKFFKKLSTLLLVLGICIGAAALTSCGAVFDMLGISFGDNDDAYEDNYHENDNFGNNYDENGNNQNNAPSNDQWEFHVDYDSSKPDECYLVGAYYHGYGAPSSITIPSSYQGTPITKIQGSFFDNIAMSYPNIKITIPDSVRTIEYYQIPYDAQNISFFEYQNGVYYIDTWAISCEKSALSSDLTLREGTVGIAASTFQGADYVQTVTLPKSLKYIGNYSFVDNYQLKSVHMGDGVVSVGEGAFQSTSVNYVDFGGSRAEINTCVFYNCSRLTTVEGSSHLTYVGDMAFNNCESLTAIDLSSVESIGSTAFSNCYSLTSITFGDSLRSIGEAAFTSCHGLESIDLPDNLESIGNYAFQYCDSLKEIILPLNIQNIGCSAFPINDGMALNRYMNCYYIGNEENPYMVLMSVINPSNSSVIIYEGTLSINEYAFYDCNSLNTVYIPDSVVTIGSHAFYLCTDLTKVVIGTGTKIISDYAFSGCNNLTEIVLPDTLEKISYSAFEYCSSLSTVKYRGSRNQWDSIEIDSYNSDFQAAERLYDYVDSCEFRLNDAGDGYVFVGMGDVYATHFIIPSEYNGLPVVEIESGAFSGNKVIRNVTVPNTITVIPGSAFSGCFSLVTVNLPTTITEISDYAFENCYALSNIELYEGLTRIGSLAFSHCYSLTSITLPSTLSEDNCIGTNAFGECTSLREVYDLSTLTSGGKGGVAANAYEVHYSADESSILYKDEYGFVFHFQPHDGQYYLIGYTGEETFVTLPDSVNGNSYVVGGYAFLSRRDIISITLGEGVTAIGGYAFSGCHNLTYFDFGASNVETIHSYAFKNCFGLIEMTISDTVSYIDSYAFEGCSYLTKIDLGSSVEYVMGSVFKDCGTLKYVSIPDTIIHIAGSAFDMCNEIVYNEYENGYYLGNDENPYVMLVKCIDNYASSFQIHPDTVIIFNNALSECDYITYLAVPEGVRYICSYAFLSCDSLETIELPSTLVKIGDNVLSTGYSLSSIIFNGSADEWNAIEKDAYAEPFYSLGVTTRQ